MSSDVMSEKQDGKLSSDAENVLEQWRISDRKLAREFQLKSRRLLNEFEFQVFESAQTGHHNYELETKFDQGWEVSGEPKVQTRKTYGGHKEVHLVYLLRRVKLWREFEQLESAVSYYKEREEKAVSVATNTNEDQ